MTAEDTSVWQRFRHNQEVNGETFRGARIEVPHVATLRCPACSFEESALFWTPAGEAKGVLLRLRCPVCNHAGGRYDLRRNRGRSPLDGRQLAGLSMLATVVAVLSLTAFMRWAPPRDEVTVTLRQVGRMLTDLPGEVTDWVEEGLAGLRDPTRTR